MGKVEINKKQKKDALLNAAFDIFTNIGINKTSISEIVEKAGVAKGTFYLYFADKYDLRNKLIAHKANKIFEKAENALKESDAKNFEDRMIFFIDNILDQLTENKSLLNFISKNLSWGIFKNAIRQNADKKNGGFDEESESFDVLGRLEMDEELEFKNKDVLVYMIVELVSSTCYSAILYSEPVTIEELKPYIFETVREMIRMQKVDSHIELLGVLAESEEDVKYGRVAPIKDTFDDLRNDF